MTMEARKSQVGAHAECSACGEVNVIYADLYDPDATKYFDILICDGCWLVTTALENRMEVQRAVDWLRACSPERRKAAQAAGRLSASHSEILRILEHA